VPSHVLLDPKGDIGSKTTSHFLVRLVYMVCLVYLVCLEEDIPTEWNYVGMAYNIFFFRIKLNGLIGVGGYELNNLINFVVATNINQ
jgi:hypothetical protein